MDSWNENGFSVGSEVLCNVQDSKYFNDRMTIIHIDNRNGSKYYHTKLVSNPKITMFLKIWEIKPLDKTVKNKTSNEEKIVQLLEGILTMQLTNMIVVHSNNLYQSNILKQNVQTTIERVTKLLENIVKKD